MRTPSAAPSAPRGLLALCLVCLLLATTDMSRAGGLFDGFPQRIAAGAANAVVYEQKPGYFARHGEPLIEEEAEVVFEPEQITIVRGPSATPLAPGQALSPVYAPLGGNSLAVPTGQVFLRFRAGETVAAHREALQQAGFTITRELDVAPQAAWIGASSGSIAEALSGLPRLRAIDGVESVEPQLLMQRAWR
jgi:hypothetical protein